MNEPTEEPAVAVNQPLTLGGYPVVSRWFLGGSPVPNRRPTRHLIRSRRLQTSPYRYFSLFPGVPTFPRTKKSANTRTPTWKIFHLIPLIPQFSTSKYAERLWETNSRHPPSRRHPEWLKKEKRSGLAPLSILSAEIHAMRSNWKPMPPEYTERIKKRVMLFVTLAIVCSAALLIYRHEHNKVRPSQEMKNGLKALTDPEALVKDL